MIRSRGGRWWGRAGVTVGVVLAVLALMPGRASAASASVDSSPRAGSVLSEAPNEIVLIADGGIEQRVSRVTLRSADGTVIPLDSPTRTPDRTQLVRPLRTPDEIGAGVYVVDYRLVLVDGRIVDGRFTFQIGTAPGGQSGALELQVPGVGGARSAGWIGGVATWLALVGLVLLVGAWTSHARSGGASSGVGRTSLRRWASVGALSLVAGSAIAFVAHGVRATASPWTRVVSPSLWAETLSTRIGEALVVRLIVALVALVPVVAMRLAPTRAWRASAVMVAVVAVGTFAVVGHGATGRWTAVGVALGAVHLGAIALWFGSVVVVALGVDDRLLSLRFHAAHLGAIAVTGGLESWRIGRHRSVLGSTAWGHALVVKSILVVVLVVVVLAAVPLRRESERRAARRLLGIACVLGLAVLAVSSVMAVSTPEIGRRSGPVAAGGVQGDVTAIVTITPAVIGANDVHVVVNRADSIDPVSEATLTLSLPDKGQAPLEVPLTLEGPGHFSAFGVAIPVSGTWQGELVVVTDDDRKVSFTLEWAIPG